MKKNFNAKSVDIHQFAMVPRADIPRSAFMREWGHKTTFDAGYLYPIMVDEVIPGDTFRCSMTAFCRLITPVYPIMDNLVLESFFFFVPLRLVWQNFKKFMGEQDNPSDSISYTVPQVVSKAGGYDIGSLQDYMGLPTQGQVTGGMTVSHSVFWLRAYNLIWNQWFRDENLQNSVVVDTDDGPDVYTDYVLKRRGKRKDYFSGALPWPLKGGVNVTMPLGTSAPVITNGTAFTVVGTTGGQQQHLKQNAVTAASLTTAVEAGSGATQNLVWGSTTGLITDLSAATAATINSIRQAFQIQRLLERDARGGTRYTELILSHFGVRSPDSRLQRPEYLGGGRMNINISAIPQTSATGLTGGTSPMGSLAAVGTGVATGHGFSQSFTEHGVILGLVSVRADLSYQQGIRKMWNRLTKYDFYWPAFAMLGEQTILNREIYCKGDADPNDAGVFGYQARWDELRYFPSMITGKFRSTAAGTLDAWHLSQKFTSLPTLNDTFVSDTPPTDRVVAVPAAGATFYFDSLFKCRTVRAMPMFSVPGLVDHF